ncbi:AEC family transporter [Paenirhodobacter sp.]|uniref:AEC family transporter n=1 Tax=Paenirhodobacter sp. TaxID=1965326 RepID=UPI003B417C53
MSDIFLALLPIALLLAAGQVLRRRRFLAEGFWPQAERLGYFILLPSLFLHGLATAEFGRIPVLRFAAVLVAALVMVAALMVVMRPFLRVDGPGFTSVFQGAIRFNNYIGVTLATGLFGAEGLAYAALCNAVIVPTVNLLSVLVFARYGAMPVSARGALVNVARNPLLLACAGGIVLRLTGLGLPPGVDMALKALGAAALPLGLLCVGAALEFRGARGWGVPVAVSSLAKFGLMPGVTWALARGFGLDADVTFALLMFQSLPTASSSYILARQLGGDAPMMAGIIAAQTLIAVVAMPVVLGLAG